MRNPIENYEDDQRFYTTAFLDATIREKLQIELDYKSQIFQNSYVAHEDIKLEYNHKTGKYFAKNIQLCRGTFGQYHQIFNHHIKIWRDEAVSTWFKTITFIKLTNEKWKVFLFL